MKRSDGRAFNQLRKIKVTKSYTKYADGSCLIEFGDTRVLCSAMVEENVPPFLKNSGKGWVTAEYGMLPRDASYDLAIAACKGVEDFDGIYLPCAQMPTITIIDRLEKELGKPVVTSVQAMIWGALNITGVNDRINGYGRLFKIAAG